MKGLTTEGPCLSSETPITDKPLSANFFWSATNPGFLRGRPLGEGSGMFLRCQMVHQQGVAIQLDGCSARLERRRCDTLGNDLLGIRVLGCVPGRASRYRRARAARDTGGALWTGGKMIITGQTVTARSISN